MLCLSTELLFAVDLILTTESVKEFEKKFPICQQKLELSDMKVNLEKDQMF